MKTKNKPYFSKKRINNKNTKKQKGVKKSRKTRKYIGSGRYENTLQKITRRLQNIAKKSKLNTPYATSQPLNRTITRRLYNSSRNTANDANDVLSFVNNMYGSYNRQNDDKQKTIDREIRNATKNMFETKNQPHVMVEPDVMVEPEIMFEPEIMLEPEIITLEDTNIILQHPLTVIEEQTEINYNTALLEKIDQLPNENGSVQIKEEIKNIITKPNNNGGWIGWTRAAALTGYKLVAEPPIQLINKVAQNLYVRYRILSPSLTNISPISQTPRTSFFSTGYKFTPKSINSIILLVVMNMNYVTDWTKKENIDIFYQRLFITLNSTISPILEQDINFRDCGSFSKMVLPHIVNPQMAQTIISQLDSSQQEHPKLKIVMERTNNMCNTIVPLLVKHYTSDKKNADKSAILVQAKNILKNYLRNELNNIKEVISEILKNEIPEHSDLEPHDIFNSDEFNDEFNSEIIEHTINNITNNIKQKILDKINEISTELDKCITTEGKCKLIKPSETDEIIQIENQITTDFDNIIKQKNIIETADGKVSIGELSTNTLNALNKLIDLWSNQIMKEQTEHPQENASIVISLLNVLDLRVGKILNDICQLNNNTDMACDGDFIRFVNDVSTQSELEIEIIYKFINDVLIDNTIHAIKSKIKQILLPDIDKKILEYTPLDIQLLGLIIKNKYNKSILFNKSIPTLSGAAPSLSGAAKFSLQNMGQQILKPEKNSSSV